MCEGHLGDLRREISALGYPIPETRAETVRRQVGSVHPPQQHQERHVGERLAGLATRKHEAIIGGAMRLHLFEDGERASGQWNPVLAVRFHSRSRHRPSLSQQIEFVPPRAYCLACSSGRQYREFKRAGSNALLLAQRS